MEEEVFELSSMDQYELLSNDDGTVLIQDNCVLIKHKESNVMKMLPLSEEVLQALGLALVLDEEDMQKEQSQEQEQQEVSDPPPAESYFMKQGETAVEYAEPMDEGHLEGSIENAPEESRVLPRDTITIVFTDDEDDEMCKTSSNENADQTNINRDWNNAGQDDAADENLPWENEMVELLLSHYADYQEEFVSKTRNNKVLWREIYLKMCNDYPILKKCNAGTLQSKFSKLKTIYKHILSYNAAQGSEECNFKNSKGFSMLHDIMNKQAKIDQENAARYQIVKNDASSGVPWKRKWTMQMLDLYERFRDRISDRTKLITYIKSQIVRQERDFSSVSVEEVRRQLRHIRAAARRRDIADPQILLLATRVFSKEPDTDEEHSKSETESKPQNDWSSDLTHALLDFCIENQSKIESDRSSAFKLISSKLKDAGHNISPIVCEAKYNKIRAMYLSLIDNTQFSLNENTWPYFKKAVQLFQSAREAVWSRADTLLLLELYGRLRRRTEDSGPKFWAELAEMYNERRPHASTTARRCEARVRRLRLRHEALRRSSPAQRRHWPYYAHMERLFAPPHQPWPNKVVNIFLAVYQRHLARFDADTHRDHDLVWKDIAKDVNNVVNQPDLVSVDACKKNMLDLKEKYGKMMKDPNAARNWPFYKRMSEIFSSHLWSKSNVSLLLDIYEAHKERVDAGDDLDSVWNDIKDRFNEVSPSSAASAAACRTELHVLRTRYTALRARRSSSNSATHAKDDWPFYKRMDEIFGDGAMPAVKRMRREIEDVSLEMDDADYCRDGENQGDTTFEWTEEATNLLLDLYDQHKPDLSTRSRVEVWRDIDQALEERLSDYRPQMNGYGAWFRYLDLMTKFMDIKENKCTDEHWPYFDRLSGSGGGGGEGAGPGGAGAGPGGAGAGPGDEARSDSTHDSIADRLQQLLEPESQPEPVADSPATRSRDKRKSAAVADNNLWSTEDTILLIDVYGRNQKRFSTRNCCPQNIWADIHRQIVFKKSDFDKPATKCDEKMSQLTTDYEKHKKYGKKLALSLRLPDKIYQKMAEVMGDSVSGVEEEVKPKENGVQAPDGDVMQRLLEQLETRNKQMKNRQDQLKQYHEQKLKLEKEKLAVLKKIQSACEKVVQGSDSKAVTQQLIKTLQECLEE